ncbi:hypothetical protein TNCV_2655181 [Trichonephila clavipes]|nr:hypothetical protein TNCV_2655181 [Trichonephila clavipes]
MFKEATKHLACCAKNESWKRYRMDLCAEIEGRILLNKCVATVIRFMNSWPRYFLEPKSHKFRTIYGTLTIYCGRK